MDLPFAWLPLFAEKNLAYVFLIAAILVATLTLLLRLYRYQKRQSRGVPRQTGRPSQSEQRASAPDSVIRWEVEMQELARDLKAEIDSKMIALGHLIRDADRAAERLEKALRASSAPGVPPVDSLVPAESGDSENGSFRNEVHTLADYGFSVEDIASRLSTSVDQVELILRLREEGK